MNTIRCRFDDFVILVPFTKFRLTAINLS